MEMDKEAVSYLRCRNCNRWILEKMTYNRFFCSESCSVQYQRCEVCGRYFSKDPAKPLKEGEPEEDQRVVCSPECAQIFHADFIKIS